MYDLGLDPEAGDDRPHPAPDPLVVNKVAFLCQFTRSSASQIVQFIELGGLVEDRAAIIAS
jgi:hypothetical protein